MSGLLNQSLAREMRFLKSSPLLKLGWDQLFPRHLDHLDHLGTDVELNKIMVLLRRSR